MLSNAIDNNYEVAVLVAGDADYVPLVEEVKRRGKMVILCFSRVLASVRSFAERQTSSRDTRGTLGDSLLPPHSDAA